MSETLGMDIEGMIKEHEDTYISNTFTDAADLPKVMELDEEARKMKEFQKNKYAESNRIRKMDEFDLEDIDLTGDIFNKV